MARFGTYLRVDEKLKFVGRDHAALKKYGEITAVKRCHPIGGCS